MIITLTSEILPAKEFNTLVPCRQSFKTMVAFAAGVGPKSAAPAAAALFIKSLVGPGVAKIYESKGMELPGSSPTRAPVK
jgi:hypothetical protein